MFGYLICDPLHLDKEAKKTYRKAYCGLCNRLAEHYATRGRMILSYDLTYIALLLSSVFEPENTAGEERCPIHPLRKHGYFYNEYFEYCRDINVILSYYKFMDDYHDEGSEKAHRRAEKLSGFMDEIRQRYPDKLSRIEKHLSDISQMEKHNETNPDLPANSFGLLMAEILDFSSELQAFGFQLGKLIYLMDAAVDLVDDIKEQQYNPLVFISGDKEVLLEAILADCLEQYDRLPIKLYKDILDNVLYSGIWLRYNAKYRKGRDHERSL